ncbi:sensor protein [Xanthomonas fragariae]|uniref:Sensor protein n=1 Tax=Xanthomonas fragariae TaxID=48664 RepID=A0A1Y6H8Y8_9XANT|nr:hypothetical protein PD885_02757 [Xanthomonas fragariae]SMR02561.1 sensor protein [Xanthomonas fragariae]
MTKPERQLLVRRHEAKTHGAQWMLWMLWVPSIGIVSGLLVMLFAYRLLSRELERRARRTPSQPLPASG